MDNSIVNNIQLNNIQSNRISIYCNIAIFIISFVVYSITLAPAVSFTDSGELAAVASTLGIAHPTGYPLFSIIGYFWTLIPLPFSNIVKLNILSALLSSASIVLFFNTFKTIANIVLSKYDSKTDISKSNKTNVLLIENKPTDASINIFSASIALCIAFSRVVWEQAVTIEVYSLHFLLLNASLLLAFKAIQHSSFRYFIAAAFTIGLGFSNHMTTLLILPAVLYLFFRNDEGFDFSSARFKQFLILIIPLLLGLSVYLYMPLRSAMSPEFDWGNVSRGFDKFYYHISGKQYQVWMFSGFDAWAANFNKFFVAFGSIFGLLLVMPSIIAIIGYKNEKNKLKWILSVIFAPIAIPLIYFPKSARFVLIFISIMIASGIAYSFNYSIHDIEPYFYSAYWAIFSLFGLSAFILAIFINKRMQFTPTSAAVSVIIPILLLISNYKDCDMSRDYSVEEYTRILIDNLPENSIIISAQWDYWCSAFWYLQRVENYRPDVVLIEKELMRRTWYPTQFERWHPEIAAKSRIEAEIFMKDLELFESGQPYNPLSIQSKFINLFRSYIEKNIDSIPVFVTLDVIQTDPDITKDYFSYPVGFAFRLDKQTNEHPVDVSRIDIDKLEASLKGKKGHLYEGIRETAAINLFNIARYAYATKQIGTAINSIRLARQLEPHNQQYRMFEQELVN